MNKKVEVIIGVYPNQISLDLSDNAISIALQYSIDDVRNIDKKNTNYSKTITVPGTKKNNKAFGSLFDVNATFDQFNPNLKIGARIVVDSSPVLEGYLQLTKVKKLNNADLQGNKISYEVVVFDDSIDFIQTLGDKLLTDLDVSDSDHDYNKTNIENAWNTHAFADLYQYPLLDKVEEGYETTDFKPAFYHKGLLNKIALDAGYSLEGSFIDSNTKYDKEIIAWDGDTPKLTDSQILSRQYKSGLTVAQDGVGNFYTKSGWGVLGDNISGDLNYNDITSTSLFDNTSGYVTDPTLSYWEVVNTGRYDFTFESRFRVTAENLNTVNKALLTKSPGSPAGSLSTFAKMLVRIDLFDSVSGARVTSQSVDLGYFTNINAGDTEYTNKDKVFNFTNVNVTEGQRLYPVCTLTSNNSFGWAEGPSSYSTSFASVSLRLEVYKTLLTGNPSTWYNRPSAADNIQDGDLIELGLYLPKKIKQKDLLSDVISRYNVYVRKHPTKTKTLILESRDDFYSNNVTVLDWTQKKDYSSEDNIKFLSDLQNKEILFSYKEDGGEFGKAYIKSTGDIYGQKKIDFDNDFTKGTKEIKSVFSSAPLIFREENNVIVPNVSTLNIKRNSSLLYWGGLVIVKDENGTAQDLSITWGTDTTATSYANYPYAGHYDNPYTPTLDIHFGEVTYEYYGVLLNSITDNNLFNNYWRNYYNQISNGKLITSKFYLKETDINFIKDNLNSRIFIKDSYYIINKIVDYKPLKDELTTVELLRIEQGSDFTPTDTNTSAISGYTSYSFVDASVDVRETLTSNSTGPFRSSVSNNVNSRDVMALGVRNYVGSGSSGVIVGDDNTIGGNSTGINVTGNNNIVSSGLENVTIVGDNQTVTESNTSIINGNTLNSTTALANERVYQELEIGSWDWSASFTKSVNHGLSVTEWKTIRNIDYTIINDADTDFQPMTAFGLTSLNATSFDLVVGSSGGTDYDDPAVNRGFITFTYLPD